MVFLLVIVLLVVLLLWIAPARVERRKPSQADADPPFAPRGTPVVPGAPIEMAGTDDMAGGGGDFGGGGSSGSWGDGGDGGGGDGGD